MPGIECGEDVGYVVIAFACFSLSTVSGNKPRIECVGWVIRIRAHSLSLVGIAGMLEWFAGFLFSCF